LFLKSHELIVRPESITNYRHLNYNSHCVIVLYRLSDCGITDEGCAALVSALRSNPSHLSLIGNTLGDSGCICVTNCSKTWVEDPSAALIRDIHNHNQNTRQRVKQSKQQSPKHRPTGKSRKPGTRSKPERALRNAA
uniref:Uncharacterized protein n=1 Tax=Sinocyclocheilus grahami TaxID=75366 RepID=A0A672QZI6_SINGR